MDPASLILGAGAALAAALVAALLLFRYAQRNFLRMMIREIPSPLDFEATLETLKSNVAAKSGWHVFTVVDQGKEIVDNGGEPIGRMQIIQFCHGPYASRMFSDESRRRMSVFSPRSVSVYEKRDGKTYVAIMNGDLMMKFAPPATREIIREVAGDVKPMLGFLHAS
jgi:uncharacterized protein (DUF302 family)